MKHAKKPVFFIVFGLILVFAASVVFGFSTQYGDIKTVRIKGVEDIRLGIDIQGGVDVTFIPADGAEATDEQLDAALEVVKLRLASLNINDSEVYEDTENDRIIVRFPWQAGEKDFDPEAAVKELGETAMLSFRVGTDTNEDGSPAGDIVLQGTDIKKAEPLRQAEADGTYSYVVSLELTDTAAETFSAVTSTMAGTGESISIWMDNNMISAPTVNEAITDYFYYRTGCRNARMHIRLVWIYAKLDAYNTRYSRYYPDGRNGRRRQYNYRRAYKRRAACGKEP